jgi:nitrogen fixation protein NifU and related proteins
MDIYQEFIMDHAKSPRNFGKIKGAILVRAANQLCGDKTDIYLKIKKNKLADIKYEIEGCILSKAALSIFSDYLKTKSIRAIAKIKNNDILKLVGGEPSPSRQKCVLFGFEAIKNFALNLKKDKIKK